MRKKIENVMLTKNNAGFDLHVTEKERMALIELFLRSKGYISVIILALPALEQCFVHNIIMSGAHSD